MDWAGATAHDMYMMRTYGGARPGCLAGLATAAARIPQWLLGAFAAFAQRKTYICQAELLAYLCAYLTFPDLLEGHLIHHFGDNMAAIWRPRLASSRGSVPAAT